MKHTRFGLLFGVALLACCAAVVVVPSVSGGAAQKQPAAGEKLPFTDQEILDRVYDKNYQTPAGFYQDSVLKDGANSLYYHQPGWFATDKDKARKIVEDFLAKPGATKDKKIEATNATKLFFDFRAGKVWYRVHKPNFFTPKGPQIDSGLLFLAGAGKPAVIGNVKWTPTTDPKAAMKELAEYLWLLRYYNVAGAKVLSSEVKQNSGNLEAVLYSTQVAYGDVGLKDEISVVKETYQTNLLKGTVTYSQQVVRNVIGKKK
jgi:hypothetical protein